MSDDDADPELLELLRKSMGISLSSDDDPPDTKVLSSAEHVYSNAIDVAISMDGTKAAAQTILSSMRERGYGASSWSSHPLHPKTKDDAAVNFIFTVDLLNFCFWSNLDEKDRFQVEYQGKNWTGYNSLLACIWRALDDGVLITSPSYWHAEAGLSDETLRHVFRSATSEPMPLLDERISILREAAEVLLKDFDMSVPTLISRALNSAPRLVNLLTSHFPSFSDCARFEGRRVYFQKRAQIFVADLWGCFEGIGLGKFEDIDQVTMFADYRVPQILHTLGVLQFSPPLDAAIRGLREIASGEPWEIEVRGCSIWAVELLRREIERLDSGSNINAVLIDFFLYDQMKEFESGVLEGDKTADVIPHHRTRCIYY